MADPLLRYFHYNGTDIPVRISFERRLNSMISVGRQYVYLRMPVHSSQKNVDSQMEWAKGWLNEVLDKKPGLLARYQVKPYKDGQKIFVNGVEFVLELKHLDSMKLKIRLVEGNHLQVWLPVTYNPLKHNEFIQKGLSRIISSQFYSQVAGRIIELNNMYFNEKIAGITIKYNKSNWGSCSRKRNINISSRILFAPPGVQDYIYIHELTHLKELNHSSRFWDIVRKIMPDYKEKEKWLRKNNHLCDF